MSYVVLARKWRPQHFADVVGQEHVARTLTNAIQQDRVAHAFLFCGPRGVGKTSTARILAKALNCQKGPAVEPCYECASCEEISRGASVDVLEIDGASNRGVGEIRELREAVHYAASRDRYKVYIIDEVHMLTTEAFNALLKTLEEPPSHVKFIFATTEPHKIPVTILSRCQRFDFKRIPIRKIVGLLEKITDAEKINVEPSALSLIARQADGGGRDALSLTDQVISFTRGNVTEKEVAEILGVASRDQLFRLSAALFSHDVNTALTILDDIHNNGHDVQQFASAVVAHLRDLTVVRVAGDQGRLTDLTEDELAVALEQVGPVEPSVIHRAFHLMVSAADEMAHSTWPKLLFEMALVKMASIEPLMPMELILTRLHTLESGLCIGGSPSTPGNTSSSPAGGHGPRGLPTSSANTEQTKGPAPSELTAKEQGRESSTEIQEENHKVKQLQGAGRPAPAAVPATIEPTPLQPSAQTGREQVQLNPAAPGKKPVDWSATDQMAAPAGEAPMQSANLPKDPPRQPATKAHAPAVITDGELLIPGMASDKTPAQQCEQIQPGQTAPSNGQPLDAERAREAWRTITRELRTAAGLARGWCLHAKIAEVRPGHVHVTFPEDQKFLVDDSNEPLVAAAAQRVLAHLWDGAWTATITINNDETGRANRSLHDEAAEAANLRREEVKASIAAHASITTAKDTFAPEQVRIILDEQDLYTWDQA